MLNLFVWLRGQTMSLTPTFIIEPLFKGLVSAPVQGITLNGGLLIELLSECQMDGA